MKVIGLLGGMSWESTLLFWNEWPSDDDGLRFRLELRQVVVNLEPASLRAHENVTRRPHAWIDVKQTCRDQDQSATSLGTGPPHEAQNQRS